MTLTPSLTPSLAAPSADTVTATLLAAKKAKGLTFAELGSLLGRDEVWVASLFYGQSTASAAEAQQLAEALNLDPAIIEALQSYPHQRLAGACDPNGSADLSLLRDHAGLWHADERCDSRKVW